MGRGRRRQEVAREGAVGLLEQVGHQLATPSARARFVQIITGLGNDATAEPRCIAFAICIAYKS